MHVNCLGSIGKCGENAGNREVYPFLLLVFIDTLSGCLKQITPSSVLKSSENTFLLL